MAATLKHQHVIIVHFKSHPVLAILYGIVFLVLIYLAVAYFPKYREEDTGERLDLVFNPFDKSYSHRAKDFEVKIEEKEGKAVTYFKGESVSVTSELQAQQVQKVALPKLGLGTSKDANVEATGNLTLSSEIVKNGTKRGVKETVYIRSKDSPKVVNFKLTTQGVDYFENLDGGIYLFDSAGKAKVWLPEPAIYDSLGAHGPVSFWMTKEADGVAILRFKINDNWFDSPERVFPLKLDPSTYLEGTVREIVNLRSQDAGHYQTDERRYQGVFENDKFYKDSSGNWLRSDLTFRESPDGFIADRYPLKTKVSNRSIEIVDDSGKGIRWLLAGDPKVSGREARFSYKGLGWSYAITKAGLKLSSEPVGSSRGRELYEFPYELLGGGTLSVNQSGDAAGGGFRLERLSMRGKDGSRFECSGWVVTGSVISATCDDSALPKDAYPYVIDPSSTFNQADTTVDGFVERTGLTYPPTGTITTETLGNIETTKSTSFVIANGLMVWSTTSIPDYAVIHAATLKAYVVSQSNADSRKFDLEWYDHNGIGTEDYFGDSSVSNAGSLDCGTTAAVNDYALTNVSTNIVREGKTGLRTHMSGGTPLGSNTCFLEPFGGANQAPQLIVAYDASISISSSKTSLDNSLTMKVGGSAVSAANLGETVNLEFFLHGGLDTSFNLSSVIDIVAGVAHTCAVTGDGGVYCWGFNFNGQLGDNSTTTRNTPVRVLKGDAATGDHDGTSLTNIKQIAVGDSHSCAVSNAGNAYCWGGAGSGKLGNNTTTPDQTTPIRVLAGAAAAADNDGTNLTNIKSFTAGFSHTCAVSNADNAYCWGSNGSGRLGDNTTTQRNTPVRVLQGAAAAGDNDGTNLTNIDIMSAGNAHTCAVSNADNAYCWGSNTNSRLGDNTTTQRETPVRVLKGAAAAADNDATNLTNIKMIGTATTHTCAVSNAGNAYCWGGAANGRLGNNTTTPDQATPVRVLAGASAAADNDGTNLTNMSHTEMISGAAHTCMASVGGNAYCWGSNSNGKLGDNTTTERTTPVRVLKGAAFSNDHDGTNLTNIDIIMSASAHSCAVSNAGAAYCWGSNLNGKLGDNTTINRHTPIRIRKGSQSDKEYLKETTAISAAFNHTCAIAAGATVLCWGSNGSGQLGDNSTTRRTTPVKVQDGAATGADSDGTYLSNIIQISTGSTYTCAVSSGGNTYCWGSAFAGALGDGQDVTDRTTPVRVQDGAATGADTDGTNLINIKQISTNNTNHTCAISNGGNTYCWGEQDSGRLGNNNGASASITTPVKVQDGVATGDDTDGTNLINIKQISAGGAHTCALSNAGNTYCWGGAANGRLGNNSTTTSCPGDGTGTCVPVKVEDGVAEGTSDSSGVGGFLINIKQISAGFSHTCAVSNGGNAYCWGSALSGKLGDGQILDDRTTPVKVQDGVATGADSDGTNLINIKQISAGESQTCAVSNGGNAYCWGNNGSGRLGDNSTTQRTTPIKVHAGEAVSGDRSSDRLVNMDSIATGSDHTCAVSSGGNAYCWGSDIADAHGELGNDSLDGRHSPIRPHRGEAITTDAALRNLKQISVWDAHTCGVANDGHVFCWGAAASGRLGNNTTTPDQTTPIRVLKGSAATADNDGLYLDNIKEVASGNAHTCAVSNGGNAYCWGESANGRLGDGQITTDRTTPVKVQDGAATGSDSDGTNLINIKQISARGDHTCAVSNGGNTYCWGTASFGRLGDDQTTTDRTTPVKVHDGAATGSDSDGTNLINIKEISGGNVHTCAVSNGGNTYCWGHNSNGKLGDNSTTDRTTPVKVQDGVAEGSSDASGGFLVNIKQISARLSHTCAVSNGGNTYCWGSAANGRLGDGQTVTDRTTPVKVQDGAATGSDTDGTNLINIQKISAGSDHTCAVSNGGNTYCWGTAASGRLGNNTTSPDQTTPIKVLKGAAVSADNDGTNLINIQEISAGTSHTCAVSDEGNTYCWGSPTNGRIGNNQTTGLSVAPTRAHQGAASFGDVTETNPLPNITINSLKIYNSSDNVLDREICTAGCVSNQDGKVATSYVATSGTDAVEHTSAGAKKKVIVKDNSNVVSLITGDLYGISDLFKLDENSTFGGAGQDGIVTDCVDNSTIATCQNEAAGEETTFNRGERIQFTGYLFGARDNARISEAVLTMYQESGSCATPTQVSMGASFDTSATTGQLFDNATTSAATYNVGASDSATAKWLRVQDGNGNYARQCDAVSGLVTSEWTVSAAMSISTTTASIDNQVTYNLASNIVYNKGESPTSAFYVYSARGTRVGRGSLTLQYIKSSSSAAEGGTCAASAATSGQVSATACQIASGVTAAHDTTGDAHETSYIDALGNSRVDATNTFGVSNLSFVSTSATGAPTNTVTPKVGGSAISPRVVNFGESLTVEFYHRGVRSSAALGSQSHVLAGATFDIDDLQIARDSSASCSLTDDRAIADASVSIDTAGLASFTYTPTTGTDLAAATSGGDVKCLKGNTDNFGNFFDGVFGSSVTWAVSSLLTLTTPLCTQKTDDRVGCTVTSFTIGTDTFYGWAQAKNVRGTAVSGKTLAATLKNPSSTVICSSSVSCNGAVWPDQTSDSGGWGPAELDNTAWDFPASSPSGDWTFGITATDSSGNSSVETTAIVTFGSGGVTDGWAQSSPLTLGGVRTIVGLYWTWTTNNPDPNTVSAVKFQLATCTDATLANCWGGDGRPDQGVDEFFGPDGTNGTYFEKGSSLIDFLCKHISAINQTCINKTKNVRWVVYKAFLSTSDSSVAKPILKDVNIVYVKEF